MKIHAFAIGGAVAAVLATAGAALAHHSFPATYQVDQSQTISGTVVTFMFRNPHSFVHVLGPDKAGKVQRWAVEWSAGASLARQNLTPTTLKPGDKVTVTGNPGRNEADHRLRMNKIVRAQDGWSWSGQVE